VRLHKCVRQTLRSSCAWQGASAPLTPVPVARGGAAQVLEHSLKSLLYLFTRVASAPLRMRAQRVRPPAAHPQEGCRVAAFVWVRALEQPGVPAASGRANGQGGSNNTRHARLHSLRCSGAHRW